MSRRIGVLYTGGTIGMVQGPQGLHPDPGFEQSFRAANPAWTGDWFETPALLDSSAMDRGDWGTVAAQVRDIVRRCDAVVVLHGTDTMAYTGSALGFLLMDLDVPVVLTGAQVPLGAPRSDAPDNIALALKVAGSTPRGEVLIAFGGVVLRAVRAVKVHAQSAEGFAAPDEGPIDWTMAEPFATAPRSDAIDQVGLLRLFPGCDAAVLAGFAGAPGLVIEAFGAGNLPGRGTSFHDGLAALRASGVEIAVTTQCDAGRVINGAYAAGSSISTLGLIPVGDMTTPAAATKLGWLLGQGLYGPALADAMQTALIGEVSA